MATMNKKYSNGEITIYWQPGICIHSKICWQQATGLPEVFNPSEKPWIKPEAATTERIVEQVKKCPSGALSFYYDNEVEQPAQVSADTQVEVMPNGPLMIYGNLTIKGKDGAEVKKHKVTAFCRCGQSANKPFCDGSHIKAGFEG
jgi:uncharacterized Fe-S cluster protein YjdI